LARVSRSHFLLLSPEKWYKITTSVVNYFLAKNKVREIGLISFENELGYFFKLQGS
jgi:hypothetical protein